MSGNLDAPEGGFDAIMQAVMCKVGVNLNFTQWSFKNNVSIDLWLTKQILLFFKKFCVTNTF